MGRLPRGAHPAKLREKGGRGVQTDLGRIRQRIADGKSIKLYRGETVRRPNKFISERGSMRRLRGVRKGQSWATTPHLAMEYAHPRAWPGRAGLLYSITVPASELGPAIDRPLPVYHEHETGRRRPEGKWTAMQDPGYSMSPYDQNMRLEIRPNVDRPDLKPKIVGTVVRGKTDGKLRYGFTRRLERRRGGAPVRGGGA